MRLVSLLPSATEIVYALGLGDDLAGVTFECDEPPAARAEKAIVVGGLDTSGMTPGDIDRYVRAQLASGQDLYTLHAQALAELEPDLILTQDLCRVCAIPSGQVSDALDYLGCHADVLTLDPHSLDEVLDSILAVGQRAGVARARRAPGGRAPRPAEPDRGERGGAEPARGGRARVGGSAVYRGPLGTRSGHRRPAAAVGRRPRCGRRGQLVAAAGAASVQTDWAAVAAAAPDLVVVAPCGYHLPGAIEQARFAVRALPDVPVWAIDADGIVVRPGPRLVNGVEALASILHPQAVPAAPPGAVHRVR